MYTREQLINAMAKYNKEFLDNPELFDELANPYEDAVEQVDHLISLIDD